MDYVLNYWIETLDMDEAMALFPEDQLVTLEVELEGFTAAVDSKGVSTSTLVRWLGTVLR